MAKKPDPRHAKKAAVSGPKFPIPQREAEDAAHHAEATGRGGGINQRTVDEEAAAQAEMMPLEHLAMLRVQAGDVVVLKSPRPLSQQQHEHIMTMLKKAIPGDGAGVRFVILDAGMEMGVVRPDGPLTKKIKEVLDGKRK